MKKVTIRIDEKYMGDLDGIDVQASMHKFCEQVQAALTKWWPEVKFDVEWGMEAVCSEGWTIADCNEEIEIRDGIDDVRNEVFEKQEWVVLK